MREYKTVQVNYKWCVGNSENVILEGISIAQKQQVFSVVGGGDGWRPAGNLLELIRVRT
jgi:hypothetical protein